MIDLACEICGQNFSVKPYRAETARFCSTSCQSKQKKNWRTAPKTKQSCRHCGSEFEVLVSTVGYKNGYGTFCSRKCVTAWRERSAAEARPYTPTMAREVDKRWSRAIRDRDKDTCQRCGKVDPSNDAHHTAPREFRPEQRFDLSNGVCLCRSCHRWVHEHVEQAKALGLLSADYIPRPHVCEVEGGRCRICGRFASPREGNTARREREFS